MPATASRRKIQLFRHVSKRSMRKRGLRPQKGHAYFENERVGVKLPLMNGNGSLQGVFETPSGQILEFRYTRGWGYRAFVNETHVGTLSPELTHRLVFEKEDLTPRERRQIGPDSENLRRMGIMSALFDRGERLHLKNYSFFPGLRLWTGKRSTALFLAQRGHRGMRKKDRQQLDDLKKSRPEEFPTDVLQNDVYFNKKTSGGQRDNPAQFYRIRVIGPKGKPAWLTLRRVEPFSPR